MTEDLEKAIGIADLWLKNNASVTEEEIDDCINTKIVLMKPVFPNLDFDVLRETLINLYCDSIDNARILEGKERRNPWLAHFKATSDCQWLFWKDYKKFLLTEEHKSKAVVDEVDRLTDMILDKLFDPNIQNIHLHKMGLVVGQVQSGKTSNYTGLICKAADSGFDLIIVLAGLLNNLRSQTQLRLDQGFLGFDTQHVRAYKKDNNSNIGVGKLNTDWAHPCSHSLTTSPEKGDFSKAQAEASGVNFRTKEPILMVLKKNKSVLSNLCNWITAKIAPEDVSGIKSVLIIDDEADNASINTRKDGSPSAINGAIREFLHKFHKVAYVGYTATPFANIFIPENDDDLFPRDFIINLSAPKNYIGPARVFGTADTADEDTSDLLPIVKTIDDYQDFVPTKHKKDDPLPIYEDIPESLKSALKSFILTCAIRWARGQQNQHNSMLVHVTRYQNWQERVKEIVERLFRYYKESIIYGDKAVINEFRKAFEVSNNDYLCFTDVSSRFLKTDMAKIDPEIKIHSWAEIKPFLHKAVQKIEVKAINGSSGDVLSYYDNKDKGISIIAIGGDKLSRGLTLEGLSVSYFLRASKMYDTLMQMGRWFGYRGGYADLCRLYTSSELNEWFRHITIASEELRKEFIHLCDVGATPDNYRLQVRSHPGCLQITAANKMRYVQNIKVSWSARLAETYALPMNRGLKHANILAIEQFLKDLPTRPTTIGHHYLWENITPPYIKELLSRFNVVESLKAVNLELIKKYITTLNNEGELNKWNVVLINKVTSPTATYTYGCGLTVGCQIRTRANDTDPKHYCIRKCHIIGANDEFLDLEDQILYEALERTISLKVKAGEQWTSTYPSPSVVREEFRDPNHPLLIIYTLDPFYANEEGKEPVFGHKDEPFVGFAISFPRTMTNYEGVSYTANLIQEFAQTEDEFDNDNDNTYES